MTTALELAINALSEPKTSTADAFRAVRRRPPHGADDLSQWPNTELNGYPAKTGMPKYRSATMPPINVGGGGILAFPVGEK